MITPEGYNADRESTLVEQRFTELFGTLSHEVRTPLATIKGYAATLLRHSQRMTLEEQREYLQAIQEASNRLEVLTNRLFDAAQLEAGIMRIELGAADIPALLRETTAVARQWVPKAIQNQTSFHLSLKDAAGHPVQELPPVRGDIRRLREVFLSLLENAIRFSPQGGPIEILVHPAPHEEQRYLEICICDNGIGIPPEQLEPIFDRFHRVDTRLAREVNGLGLGLTICRHLIALHQGRIWAKSCPEGGSAFYIWLPFVTTAPAC